MPYSSSLVQLTASANADPEARSHSPTSSSQALKPHSKPSVWSHQGFARIMINLHQSVLSILSVWSISAVYQTPCLCSVGFLNRSDKISDIAFRDQGQRIVHLYAALQVCIAPAISVLCQGDRIPLDFALVHQRLRDCVDEAHVDSEAETKVLMLCIVSVERCGLPRPLRSLSSSALRASVIIEVL